MDTLISRTSLVAYVCFELLAIACSSGSPTIASEKGARSENTDAAALTFLGNLADETITEASGMVASGRRKDLLWIINDGGNPPVLHAVGLDGSNRGRVSIRKAHNKDWEDLAAFRYDGRPYLLIADCGDNHRRRTSSFLYAIEEPRVGSSDFPVEISVAWTWRIEYAYVDGPRDCEGVAVDMDSRQILLLTKRTVPPVVYALPLFPDANQNIQLARPLATVNGIPAPTADDVSEDPLFGRFRSQPTAMDISPDGKIVAVQTYKRPYLFHRQGNESWPQVFNHPPVPLNMPRMQQAEAMCFGADGTSLFVTSEKLPAPLYRLDIMP